jgi:DNA polymerase (family 10)
VLRGIECDIPDGRLDLPDEVLAELDWCRSRCTPASAPPES